MKPTGRREAPPDGRLAEIRDQCRPSPHCASLHAGYSTQQKRRSIERLFSSGPEPAYFAAGLAAAGEPAGGLASSFLRASSARFCNSSCSLLWFSSNTFGSVGG